MSGDNQADDIHAHWRASDQRFDYFVLGATGALCAFISQTFAPERLAWSPATAELLALLLLAMSAVFGFLRIEVVNLVWGVTYRSLTLEQENEAIIQALNKRSTSGAQPNDTIVSSTGDRLSIPDANKLVEVNNLRIAGLAEQRKKYNGKGQSRYKARNWLLFAGVVILLAARIWKPYFCG